MCRSQMAGTALTGGKSSFGLQNGPTGSAGLCSESQPSLWQKLVSPMLEVSEAMEPAVSTVRGWPRYDTAPVSLLLPPPGTPGGLWTPVHQKQGLYTLGCTPGEKKPNPKAPVAAQYL